MTACLSLARKRHGLRASKKVRWQGKCARARHNQPRDHLIPAHSRRAGAAGGERIEDHAAIVAAMASDDKAWLRRILSPSVARTPLPAPERREKTRDADRPARWPRSRLGPMPSEPSPAAYDAAAFAVRVTHVLSCSLSDSGALRPGSFLSSQSFQFATDPLPGSAAVDVRGAMHATDQ